MLQTCYTFLNVYNLSFSDFCSFDLLAHNIDRHIQNVHELSTEDAENISKNQTLLFDWRQSEGFTSIPGQCGFCGEIDIDQRAMKRHVKSCKMNPNTSRLKKFPDSGAETRIW